LVAVNITKAGQAFSEFDLRGPKKQENNLGFKNSAWGSELKTKK
jgi:hypothetical protein